MSVLKAIYIIKTKIVNKKFPQRKIIFNRNNKDAISCILYNSNIINTYIKKEHNECNSSLCVFPLDITSGCHKSNISFVVPIRYYSDVSSSTFSIKYDIDKCEQELSEIKDYDIETFLSIHYLFENVPINLSDYNTHFVLKQMGLI